MFIEINQSTPGFPGLWSPCNGVTIIIYSVHFLPTEHTIHTVHIIFCTVSNFFCFG